MCIFLYFTLPSARIRAIISWSASCAMSSFVLQEHFLANGLSMLMTNLVLPYQRPIALGLNLLLQFSLSNWLPYSFPEARCRASSVEPPIANRCPTFADATYIKATSLTYSQARSFRSTEWGRCGFAALRDIRRSCTEYTLRLAVG